MARCQLLLERATSSYAQLLAATTLTKLVSRPAQIISLEQRIQIRMSRHIVLHVNEYVLTV